MNKYFEDKDVTGIGVIDECAMIRVSCPFDKGAVSQVFEKIDQLDVNIDMISQQLLDDRTEVMSFSCPEERAMMLAQAKEARCV